MELALVLALLMYFIPTVIAFCRGHSSKWGIFVMNVLLGWSVIFWIWAFIWSLSNKGGSVNVNVNNVMNNRNG